MKNKRENKNEPSSTFMVLILSGKKKKVWWPYKVLYGLKQANLSW